MRSILPFVAVAAVSPLASGEVFRTVTVDFDDQIGGLPGVVTDGMFSEFVTFSTNPDHVMLLVSSAGVVGGSNPNSLTAAESTQASDFDSDIYMDFTGPVQNLTLDILADNDAGAVGSLRIFHAGGESVLDVIGNADFTDAIPTDLSGFTDITRVELFNITDEFGLSIDNLVFDTKVPAPGSLALLGMGALATARRRR